MRRMKERIGHGVIRYGGTDLDHALRGASYEHKSLRRQLKRAQAHREKAIANMDADIARLERLVAEATARLKEVRARKVREEPDQPTPGLPKARVPDELTLEEWHELRRQGKHIAYLEQREEL
jgi:hypothetical protein